MTTESQRLHHLRTAAGAIALLAIAALCLPAFRILKAHADQAPVIAWNVRTATFNAATATWKAAEAATNVAKISGPMADEKTGVLAEVRATRQNAVDAINSASGIINSTLDFLDRRTVDTLGRVDGVIRLAANLESKIAPTLEHAGNIAAALDTAAQENIPCVDPITGKGRGACWPARITAIMGGASVFLGEGAQAARRIDAALPEYLELGQEIARNFGGITSDVHGVTTDLHTFTSKFTAPRTKKQKAWDVIQTVLLLGARAGLAR